MNNPVNFFVVLYAGASLANLLVEVETRHSHQILLDKSVIIFQCNTRVQDKMDNLYQKTCSNAFSWIEINVIAF